LEAHAESPNAHMLVDWAITRSLEHLVSSEITVPIPSPHAYLCAATQTTKGYLQLHATMLGDPSHYAMLQSIRSFPRFCSSFSCSTFSDVQTMPPWFTAI
jgi:hypothetical protein